MSDRGPKAFLVEKPNSISVAFGGKHVNITELSRSQGLSISHVSRALSGNRDPSMPVFVKLASALGMTLDDFVAAVDDRKATIVGKTEASLRRYKRVITKEKFRKSKARNQGRPYVPNAALGRAS